MRKYIEIKDISNPEYVFKKIRNSFIDVMYCVHSFDNSIVMLLDVSIDPNSEEDMIWLKEILDTELPVLGETKYYIQPFTPSSYPFPPS